MIRSLTPKDVFEALERGEVVLIDVRNAIEFAQSRVLAALNAPLSTLDPANLPNGERRETVLMCGSGVRSEMAAKRCLERWQAPVYHMEGGLEAWRDSNLPYLAINPVSGEMSETVESSK